MSDRNDWPKLHTEDNKYFGGISCSSGEHDGVGVSWFIRTSIDDEWTLVVLPSCLARGIADSMLMYASITDDICRVCGGDEKIYLPKHKISTPCPNCQAGR